VESKWKNDHITTFPGQSLSKTGLSLEEAMDLSRDRQIEEEYLEYVRAVVYHWILCLLLVVDSSKLRHRRIIR
jgi:hypothetical protein